MLLINLHHKQDLEKIKEILEEEFPNTTEAKTMVFPGRQPLYRFHKTLLFHFQSQENTRDQT